MEKKNKKKKIVVIIIILLVVITLFIGWLFMPVFNRFGHTPKKLSNSDGYESALPEKDILINYSFMNGAWSYTYYGELILKDGKHYSFNCTERGANNCRLKEKKSISEKDLKKIKSYEAELSDNLEYQNNGADMGETTIMYYRGEEIYTLVGKGDRTIKNNSSGAKKILKVLLKYGIYT